MLHLSKPELISNEVILIDGLTRAGKFLLGKLVSNLKGIEYFQSQNIIEQLPFFNYLQLGDEQNFISLLRLSINTYSYERFIGRNLNERNESSSVLNSTELSEYNLRKTLPDGEPAVRRSLEQKRIPSFLVHECLPHIEFIFKALPQAKMINIQRHPLDISYSWFRRGWGDRWGNDNLVFTPTIQYKNKACPWFTKDWLDEWVALENRPMDRVIKSIVTLFTMEQKAYEAFPDKNKILRLNYEGLFENPQKEIQSLSDFLDTSPFANMNQILEREGCPNPMLKNEREICISKLKKLASPEYYQMISTAALDYESFWNLESSVY
jgi:hypothetical protein